MSFYLFVLLPHTEVSRRAMATLVHHVSAMASSVIATVVRDLFWLIIGFAMIQAFIYFHVMPHFNLSPLGDESSRGDKCAAKGAADLPESTTHKAESLRKSRQRPVRAKAEFPVPVPVPRSGPRAAAPRTGGAAAKARCGARQLATAAEALRRGGAAAVSVRLASLRPVDVLGSSELQARIAELFKVAVTCKDNAVAQLLDGAAFPLPTGALAAVLGDCLAREDAPLARRVEDHARRHQALLNFTAYEALLKLYAKVGDERAAQVFEDMQNSGCFASEGLCGNLLSRCGDSEHLELAERIVQYLRSRSSMTMAIFKTLMRVYARCGKYDKACDLHEEVLAAGLEPDEVMCGCLFKFAAKCGRPILAEQVAKKSKIGSTVQDCIHLMRQALSTRDSNMALHVLRQYEAGAKDGMDVSIHNAALATLFGSGEVERAQEIFAEMTAKGLPNVVTYNTMVKAYCAKGDITNTRSLLKQMGNNGIEPDAVTYNSLLDCTVKTGALPDALQVLDEMEATGLPFDKYTISIMMKAARRARCPRDACMALAILDRSPSLDICGDDVALNMVLHACLQHQSTHYLELVLNRFLASDVRPSATTCSLLHQAAGTLAQGLPQRLSALELEQELSQRLSALELEQPTNGRNSAPDTQQLRRVVSTPSSGR